jgi:hypothetical protein
MWTRIRRAISGRRLATMCVLIAALLSQGFECNSGALSASQRAAKALAAGFGSWEACVAAGKCHE